MSALVPHVPADLVDRLAKVAGLLGSDHDGERAAAAFRATELIKAAGLTWRQLIKAAGPRQAEPTDGPEWREQIRIIAQHPQCLTSWETDFVLSVMAHGRKWEPSAKQAAVIARIWRKVVSS